MAEVLNNLETLTMGSWNASTSAKSNAGKSVSMSSHASSVDDRDDDSVSVFSDQDRDDRDGGNLLLLMYVIKRCFLI